MSLPLDDLPRTRWFPGTWTPTRPGVYERQFHKNNIYFAVWTGHQWLLSASTPATATFRHYPSPSMPKASRWRGLLKETV